MPPPLPQLRKKCFPGVFFFSGANLNLGISSHLLGFSMSSIRFSIFLASTNPFFLKKHVRPHVRPHSGATQPHRRAAPRMFPTLLAFKIEYRTSAGQVASYWPVNWCDPVLLAQKSILRLRVSGVPIHGFKKQSRAGSELRYQPRPKKSFQRCQKRGSFLFRSEVFQLKSTPPWRGPNDDFPKFFVPFTHSSCRLLGRICVSPKRIKY